MNLLLTPRFLLVTVGSLPNSFINRVSSLLGLGGTQFALYGCCARAAFIGIFLVKILPLI